MIFEAFFWTLLLFIAYVFVGYPLVLKCLSFFLAKPVNMAAILPPLTLIISAYNEEKNIAEKIENALSLEYPREKLEIVVVSDASTDRTEEIAGRYASEGVETERIEGRVGKTACLNQMVPKAKGEIIVFSDANSRYEKNALIHLVRNFSDDQVGFVSGYTKYLSKTEGDEAHETVNLYSRLEKITKSLESEIGSCVGADGAIFAIRKNLYRTLGPADINDFVIPLQIVGQGYRGVLEKEAYCLEESAADLQGEYRRQVRITNRTLRAIFNNFRLFHAGMYGLFSFELFSHKLAKLLVPFALIGLFIVNLLLLDKGWVYIGVFACQVLFYGAALWRTYGEAHRYLSRIGDLCRSFVVVHAAILMGWWTYAKGEQFITWKKVR